MKSALVISVQGIGNTVLMTPVVKSLAEDGYEVDTVVSDNGSHEIIAMTPNVRQRYLWIEQDRVVSNLLRLRSELSHDQYDVAYALYPNGKRENTLLCLARASLKIRYSDAKHFYSLLDFLPAGKKLPLEKHHDVKANLNLFEVNGTCRSEKPQLSLSEQARQFADQFVESNDLRDELIVALHPGGGGAAKRWSEDKYRELASRLTESEGIRILVVGSTSEAPLVQRITEALDNRVLPVCGLSLDKVAALVARCSLLIGNDSALAHIAAALDIPVVAIWGYTDFYRVAPFNPKGLLIRIDYPCNPCYEFASGYIDDCRYHLKCIRNISIEQVHRVVELYISLLRNDKPLHPRVFAGEPGVANCERLEGGCLKIDLKAV
jgi:lipopolysaccharide heptosyltransferase II